MYINKYIELLRFYLIDKLDEIKIMLQDTLKDEINNLISVILSSIIAFFISSDFIDVNGFWGVAIKIMVLLASYGFLKYYIFDKLFCHLKNKRGLNNYGKGKLDVDSAKCLIDEFDHVACDGILLALDFLKKYKASFKKSIDERQLYLIEAFYYYKKAIDVTEQVVDHGELCINNINKDDGISRYRLINIYKLFKEIKEKIFSGLDETYNHEVKEVEVDIKNAERIFKKIEDYVMNLE